MVDADPLGRPRDHDQPLEAGEGPARHRTRGRRADGRRLPRLPALHRERGLLRPRGERGGRRAPGTPEPPDRAHRARRGALGIPVLALCLLQRALHRHERRAPAHARGREEHGLSSRPRHRVPALLLRLERRPADRRRVDPLARPLPGRTSRLPDDGGQGGREGRAAGIPRRGRRHRRVAAERGTAHVREQGLPARRRDARPRPVAGLG